MSTEEKGTKRKQARKLTVAEYLDQQISISGKSQQMIAREVGFPKANILSMIKKGSTKLPMAKVGPMARALGVDPIHLFRMCMEEYEPETWRAIEEGVMQRPLISQNEEKILEVIRSSNNPNPLILNDEHRAMIAAAVEQLPQG